MARATAAVRGLHRFLAEEGRTATDPAADVAAPRAGRPPQAPVRGGGDGALLGAVVGNEPVHRRDRAVLELLYGTGMRISELCGLSLGDLDPESALVRVFGKGAKERIVPVGRPALAGGGRLGRPERAPPPRPRALGPPRRRRRRCS